MGTGDWNDGMNRVGAGGKGESVWVAWFQIVCLHWFAEVAERRGDVERTTVCRERVEHLRAAIEEHAWDGAWYRRAYFDDGTPLGTAGAKECAIDSIAQSWSVLSAAADPDRQRQAIASAVEHLVRRDDRLILLLTPPFGAGNLQPGYIKGYLPGVRENGGQYTHAAVWLVQAVAELGQGGEAYGLFDLLNPVRHADTAERVRRYLVEPYVVAADVYGVAPHVGRGGWTWYTGSAGWLYRAGLESLLGFTRRGEHLVLNPRIPSSWNGFSIEYRFGKTTYRIRIENPRGVEKGVARVWLDGQEVSAREVRLVDDGSSHEVRAEMG
jgi:cyclic beta-1,2-glucan synthetase